MTPTSTLRKFWAVLACAALAIAAGNLACGNTISDIDKSDETDGAT